jgi:hypothetical protein
LADHDRTLAAHRSRSLTAEVKQRSVNADAGGGVSTAARSPPVSYRHPCHRGNQNPYTDSDQRHGPNASHNVPPLGFPPNADARVLRDRLHRDYSAVRPV